MPSIAPRYGLGTIIPYTAGEAVEKGQYLYVSGPRTVAIARSSEHATRHVIGAAFRAAASGARILVLTDGKLPGLTGITPGAPYFLQADGYGAELPPTAGFILKVGLGADTGELIVRVGELKIKAS
jgi:hypothetical protein